MSWCAGDQTLSAWTVVQTRMALLPELGLRGLWCQTGLARSGWGVSWRMNGSQRWPPQSLPRRSRIAARIPFTPTVVLIHGDPPPDSVGKAHDVFVANWYDVLSLVKGQGSVSILCWAHHVKRLAGSLEAPCCSS